MQKFTVVAGVPAMEAEWNRLVEGLKAETISKSDRVMAKKFAKAILHLQENPFHPGLRSHEITPLSSRYGRRVFQSYLENNTPSAGRIFWVYGPRRGFITVIGLEPHPEDAARAYARVLLSELPTLSEGGA